MVRVYVSVGMEGVAGISHAKPTMRGDAGYPEAVALMNGEANAGQADVAATIPGFSRIGDRGVQYTADESVALYRAFLSAVRLAGTADD